ELRGISHEVADVDRLLLRRPFDVLDPSGTGDLHEQLREGAVTDRLIAPDVEDLAVAGVAGAGSQECVRRIVDEDEIAALRPVTVNLDGRVFDRAPDEPANEALTVVTDQLSRTVDVRETQRTGADAEDVVVDEVVILARRLVDAIDIGRSHEMLFRH